MRAVELAGEREGVGEGSVWVGVGSGSDALALAVFSPISSVPKLAVCGSCLRPTTHTHASLTTANASPASYTYTCVCFSPRYTGLRYFFFSSQEHLFLVVVARIMDFIIAYFSQTRVLLGGNDMVPVDSH